MSRRDVLFYVPHVGPLLAPTSGATPTGGAETQMVLLARELARRGLRVAFVVYADYLPRSVDGIEFFHQRKPRVDVPGVRSAEAVLRTLAAVWRGNGSVVVERNASVVTGIVAIAARLTRRPFVYSSANVVDFDFGRLERNRLKLWLYHVGVRLAGEVVVQTTEQVELARTVFGTPARLIRSIAEPAEARSGTPGAFLWIGRLVTYKQPHAYLDLAAAVPEASFRMVGVPSEEFGADLVADVAERARSLPNVELLEPRPRRELAQLYDDAVAVVNTADYEGMPNIFLEGWSRGVPALALRHDPDGTIVREGIGAFADGDATALARHARALWAQRADQHELSERCRAYVRRQHSVEQAARAWSDVIGVPLAADDGGARDVPAPEAQLSDV